MIIEGYNPPTTSTPGNVGDKYVDLASGSYYECTAVNPQRNKYGFITIDNAVLGTTEYVWEEAAGAGGASGGSGGSADFDAFIEGREFAVTSNVASVRNNAFGGNLGLTSVSLPNATSIGVEAFVNCNNLTSIYLPKDINIDFGAFYNCTSLTTIKYAGTVEQWGNVSLGHDWNYNVPATEVICSDGTVPLT